MAASPFQISGLGSGVDTASMLDALRSFRMRPATLEQNKQQTLVAKQSAWLDLNARLLALQTSAQSLTSASAFSTVKGASGDESVATVTATSAAVPGAVSMKVERLAQARKVMSNPITLAGATTPLDYSGKFSVNGKVVEVTEEDSLQTLAAKINALGVGASASVIQVTGGSFTMTIGGTTTGAQNALSLADLGGGDAVLTGLGVLNGTGPTFRYGTGATVAASNAFSSATKSLAELTGLSGLGGTPSFKINGIDIGYTTSDTLTTLAASINAAGSGATATVITDADARQRLQISGVTAAAFDTGGPGVADDDPHGLMGLLGITQAGSSNQLAAAQDAKIVLDGNLAVERPTNTISDVLTGVTLNLKKGDNATTTLTFDKDTQASADLVNNFVKTYNDLMGKIKAQFAYTPGVASPPLFGDFTLQQIQDSVAETVTGVVSGQPQGFSSLRDIGISLGETGLLTVNSAALNTALGKDAASVARLFTASGSATNPAVTYLTSTSDTRVSTTGYDVQVTAVARRAEVVAGAFAPGAEVLTFGGSLFGSAPAGAKTVSLSANASLSDTIAQINASEAGKYVVASDDGTGKLRLRSVAYGAAQNFTVQSNQASGSSGIGTGLLDTKTSAGATAGANVAGTINGETAAGVGQTLTGSQNDGAAKGLAILIAAADVGDGSFGKITVQRGMAASLAKITGQLTDFFDGTLKQEQDSLQARIDASKKTVEDITASVDRYIENMQRQFTRMESQISKFKAQSASLAQTISGLPKYNNDND